MQDIIQHWPWFAGAIAIPGALGVGKWVLRVERNIVKTSEHLQRHCDSLERIEDSQKSLGDKLDRLIERQIP